MKNTLNKWVDFMEKTAKLKSTLQPHQQRVLDKLRTHNVLIAHGLGSGKTLSSIAAADALGMPTTVLTPASLVNNYYKEIDKHVLDPENLELKAESINKAVSRHTNIDPDSLLILDEAHGLRNSGTAKSKYIRGQLASAGRVALLTGTPVYNDVSDIAPIINMLHQEKVVPDKKTDFYSKFVQEHKIKPGFISSLFGAKPGVRYSMKNLKTLENLLKDRVDYHESSGNFPKRIDEEIVVPMSKKQTQVYNFLNDEIPWHIRHKIQNNLPPSKTEAKSLNAFMSGIRQAATSIAPYVKGITNKEVIAQSPKLQTAIDKLTDYKNKHKKLQAFVYSNYLDAALKPMEEALKAKGIKAEMFHGGLTKKQKNAIVDRYNKGQTEVILGSSSASEGLDLKGTNIIQILEPHFNNAKLDQVIGRGIRYKSHDHLPEKDRKVVVQKFKSRVPGTLSWLFRTKPKPAVDDYIYSRADEKQQLMNQVTSLLKKVGQ